MDRSWSRGVLPVLLIELQHHVVRGDTQRPSALVVLLPLYLIHVRRWHQAVVGVVVCVDRASVVPRDVELDFYDGPEKKEQNTGTIQCVVV